jgi:hypothetical protein
MTEFLVVWLLLGGGAAAFFLHWDYHANGSLVVASIVGGAFCIVLGPFSFAATMIIIFVRALMRIPWGKVVIRKPGR